MSSNQKDPRITNRNNWVFIFVVSIFAILIAFKIAVSPLEIDMSQFKFGDLLNLLLAFFAIAMSVAFYFKATDTSNQFYDNTYKFTTEISEILGRIEAGFGERLKHLDEGYAGIRARFEHMPIDHIKAEEAIKKEVEEVKKQRDARKQLLEDLAKRAQLQEHEKEEIFKQLRQKERALAMAQQELNFLRSRVERPDRQEMRDIVALPDRLNRYLRIRLIRELGGPSSVLALSPQGIQKRFDSIKNQFPDAIVDDLREVGLLDESGLLTRIGANTLRHLAFKQREER